MTRYSNSHIIIFLGVFLGISVIGNLAFYLDQSAQSETLTQLQAELGKKTEQLELQKRKDGQRQEQLDAVNTQQTEFAEFIRQLQEEITTLQEKQSQSAETAELTRQQLEQARKALTKNTQSLVKTKQSLVKTKRALEEAQSIIQNQQRALWKNQAQNGQLSRSSQEILAQLTQTFSSDEQVHLLQSQNTVQLNLPVDVLFDSTEPILSSTANHWLEPIASLLTQYSDVNVQVIGHADARPIVSEISERYPTNWELSTARASRVVSELVKFGVPEAMLMASGQAANQPIREDSNETSWMVNRRIEIVIR